MSNLRFMTRVAILAAVGFLLMMFEVTCPGAPFLKYDAGDIPVLIGAFALGPTVGVAVAALKNLLFALFHGSPDAVVGAFMNFIAGASFAVCAGYIYFLKKTKRRAILSLIAGALCCNVTMFLANLMWLPWFMHFFFGSTSPVTVRTLLAVIVPFNALKSALNGLLVFLVYKSISPYLKSAHWELPGRNAVPLGPLSG